ncbi:MAG: sigma-70 family RNA polymerase sigma factor [Peptococcaceae bacterium]|nr:sigma-70 family RNA polymerase sigma factor [Peptococcaceae bacterium]
MALNAEQIRLLGTLQRNKNVYYRLALSFMGNEAEALDAISQMTLLIVEKIHTLRSAEAFLPWSKKILVNVCKEFWRKNPRTLPIDEALAAEGESGLHLEEELMLRQEIMKLSENHREVIYLRYYLDYEYKEIARILEVPEGTVKSRLNRAVEILRTQMGGEEDE